MARLTKTEATRQLGISRTPLYKLIDQGKVSATPDGLIDETELGRAAPYVDILKERARPSRDTEDVDMDSSHEEQRARPSEPVHARPWTSTDPLGDILREQWQRAQERERVYEECERDYREHIAQLTAMLDQAPQQHQRLLDMPRTPAAGSLPVLRGAPAPPRHTPRVPTLQTSPGDAKGARRWRIVALLQEHPEGLTPAEMRPRLGVETSLTDT